MFFCVKLMIVSSCVIVRYDLVEVYSSFCFSYVSLVMCLVSCLVCHVFCVTLQVLLSLRVDDDDEAKIRIIKAEPKC